MPKQLKLRQRYFNAQNIPLGDFARDAQELFDGIPVVTLRTVESQYKEPLTLGSLLEEPFSIELVRVLNLTTPTTVMKCGTACHFTWLPALNGAQINSIDGLSPVTDGLTTFRFYFRVTYRLP